MTAQQLTKTQNNFKFQDAIKMKRPALPLVSIADIATASEARKREIADEIGNATREYGFLRLCDHGIDQQLIEETYKSGERFFALSDAQKREYYIANSSNHRGYVPFTEKGDYPDEKNRSYEAFDMGLDLPATDPDYQAGNRVLGPNVWPEIDNFKEIVGEYYRQISALGRLVVGCMELHLGLPKGTMTQHMQKPISQLRLLHYVRQSHTKNHASVNMGAHTDYECLTLLHTRNKGFQVMANDDSWIDVPVDPNVFIVNVGDMMEAWTNGIFRSTPHRVVNTSPERFSLPYFVAADYNTVIEPFPELVTDERPSTYEPFIAGAHLERMLCRDFPYLKHMDRSKFACDLSDGTTTSANQFERRINQGH
ncbi:MAG: isopenicillin N synthase family dioxygenase [Planktomarina sp.]